MTTGTVGKQRVFASDEARLTKNAKIAASQKATRERRQSQVCRVFELKIVSNKLNTKQRESLARLFLEAKWLKNDIIGSDDISGYKPGSSVTVIAGADRTPEVRQLEIIGSQMKQAVHAEVKDSLRALAASKARGRKVGRLRFVTEVTSINLKQYDRTYRIDDNRISVQNIPGWMRVRGVRQFLGKNLEFANAKIVQRADGFYLLVTAYQDKRKHNKQQKGFTKGTSVGIDAGVKAHFTLSDGTKVNAYFGETDRLKRLRRKVARQQKGSAEYKQTWRLIRQEMKKITDRKDNAANQLMAYLVRSESVVCQDEQIKSWFRKSGYIKGGRKMQPSIQGRMKSLLARHDRVIVLDRWVATTQTCVCGVKNKHHVSKRTYNCTECGHTDDRDIHAAKMMLEFAQVPTDRREITRVEWDTLMSAGLELASLVVPSSTTNPEAASSLG